MVRGAGFEPRGTYDRSRLSGEVLGFISLEPQSFQKATAGNVANATNGKTMEGGFQ